MSPVAFILGAGGHVGLAVANKLKQEGYKVAVGSRKPLQKEGLVPITVDVSNTDSVTEAFAEVKRKLGSAPNVVVFNVADLTLPTVPGDPSTVELSAVKTSADITVGLYASIQQAVAGFRSLPADSSVPKTFIFTGNRIPFLPRDSQWSSFLNLGLQKIDGAYLAEIFHAAYEKEGFRFYYGDECKSDGSPANMDWSDVAHATAYWDAISRKERGSWYLRFGPDGKPLLQ